MPPARQAAQPRAQGHLKRNKVPTIACINKATVGLEVDFDELIAALQKYVDRDLAPVWGTPAKLVKATNTMPGAWTLIFMDTADRARSLGHHDLTKHGLPNAKVFVEPTLDVGELISVAASHELAEMLIDPGANIWCAGPGPALYAYEICDPVEEQHYEVDDLAMCNFVYPAYFEEFRKRATRFDHLKKVKRPFQILEGGYIQIWRGKKVKKMFGSRQKEMRFLAEDRRLHRSEFRDAQVSAQTNGGKRR